MGPDQYPTFYFKDSDPIKPINKQHLTQNIFVWLKLTFIHWSTKYAKQFSPLKKISFYRLFLTY